MKRALVLLVATLTACGGSQKLTAEEARNAMPGTSQAQLATPQSGSALTAESAAATPYVPADYAADTVGLATAVNLGVAWPLIVLETVTAFTPTSCAGDTCTWGPGSQPADLNDFEITVTKKDTSDYLWTMQGKSKADPAAPWISFVSGEAFTTAVRHVGHGTLVVDLDAIASLANDPKNPKPTQTGKISATYDNTSGRHVSVQFLGTQDDNHPGQKINAAYQFSAGSTGGDLQVSTRNLTSGDKLQLHSRWTDVGAGRGDASFFDGSAQATYTRSQCWNIGTFFQAFPMTYQVTTPAAAGLGDMGDPAACVFATAELPTLTVP